MSGGILLTHVLFGAAGSSEVTNSFLLGTVAEPKPGVSEEPFLRIAEPKQAPGQTCKHNLITVSG